MPQERKNFGKLREVIPPPNLIENQIFSFNDFLQLDESASARKNVGLDAVFREAFPVESNNGNFRLEYLEYGLVLPKQTELECIREGTTYAISVMLKLRLREKGAFKDEEILMGEIPMITDRGSFIVNGAERVVVSQLHRSPGICFEESAHTSGKMLHAFRIIPDRGTWIEVQFDQNDLLWVYLDRRRRRRKFLVTTLLRAFGYKDDKDILALFYQHRELTAKAALELDPEELSQLVYADPIVDVETGKVVAKQYDKLSRETLKEIHKQLPKQKFGVFDTAFDNGSIILSLRKDIGAVRNEEEALKEIFRKLRPGEPVNVKGARAHMQRLFQDPLRYDLGRVGRYKLNQKLSLNVSLDTRTITPEDIVEATKLLCKLSAGDGAIDDIDHLGSRRVRNAAPASRTSSRRSRPASTNTTRASTRSPRRSSSTRSPSAIRSASSSPAASCPS
jgi:DNA-directed RNA polymerase subunit beta